MTNKTYGFTFSVNDVTVIDLPLDGGIEDVSALANHGTNSGVDLLATIDNPAGIYSYNLRKGFDYYTKDSDGSAYYVPYLNGSPVVSSVTGYTKVSEHPALEVGHNGAPVVTTPPSSLIMMDRNNATVFNNSARTGVTFDSGNTSGWEFSDLTIDNIISWTNAGYLHRVYDAMKESLVVVDASGNFVTDASGFVTVAGADDDTVAMERLLIYGTQKTASEDNKVFVYEEKSTFEEK